MGRAQGLAPFLIVLGVYRCVQVICPGRPHVSASRKGIHQLLRIDGSWCPVCLRLIIRASPEAENTNQIKEIQADSNMGCWIPAFAAVKISGIVCRP